MKCNSLPILLLSCLLDAYPVTFQDAFISKGDHNLRELDAHNVHAVSLCLNAVHVLLNRKKSR